jgi:hypothetical protein
VSRTGSLFSPRAVVAMLVVGAGAFLVFLYAIAAGWDDRPQTGGTGHAASNGLNGYSALLRLLERRGLSVSTSRSQARLDDRALLVLTPRYDTDADKLSRLINARRYQGPTIVILPKYYAFDMRQLAARAKVKRGWVMLGEARSPEWLGKLEAVKGAKLVVSTRRRWQGLGLSGVLPDPAHGVAVAAASVAKPGEVSVLPLVADDKRDLLVGYLNDNGSYPMLDDASGFDPSEQVDKTLWPVVIVAEPDLLNNYGFADATRARLAIALFEDTRDRLDLPIVFDLTLAGFGSSKNLLTLAFEPPFLAATLCLLLAALVIAWRALRRFGPPVAEAPPTTFGKAQLARNAAGLIERSRRLHLLGPPYAALIGTRIAARLGITGPRAEVRDEASARLLQLRGMAEDYRARLDALRTARTGGDLIRAARALKTIERTLAV